METPSQFSVKDHLPFLDDIISSWFNDSYTGLTDPQIRAIPLIHAKENVLVSSPTGTGKTLSGFLAIINELFSMARNGTLEDNIYCVYISPLKALANDINKNLNAPLKAIYEKAAESEIKPGKIRVAVRSGDTPQSERQKMLRKPPHILITTPESLSLALSAPKFREYLKTVKYVIVDEIHELSSNKRGSLLSVNLERLEDLSPSYTRIGLSATQAPLNLIANFLCGYSNGKERPCNIIEVDTKKFLELNTMTPVRDLTTASYEVANEKMYDILADLIEKHRTTLIFTNTRSGTEHVAIRLKARGIESIEAHHSSLGKDLRIDVENKLKEGELKCVITSTSLELGIDIGYIDLVVQIGTPKSVSKALQRTGRSGHGINDISQGRFVVFDLDDLVECAVLTKAAYDKEIDKVVIPENPLDVLSQVLVGMSLEHPWTIDEALSILRRSFTFHTLTDDEFFSVIRYLSGTMEESAIYSKIWYDEAENTFGKKRTSRMIYFMNVGTIPEDADYQVVNERGKHLGQLSDKFVERLKPGDVFVLGAKTYQFIRTSRNRVSVKDGQGLRPTVPSWTGEMLPRSYDLGVLIGKFREEASARLSAGIDITEWLMTDFHLDEFGANSIISYIKAQMNYSIPTDTRLFVEGYIDKDGLFSTIYHVPLGRRVNEALSRAFAQAISNKFSVNSRITVTDDGFIITSPSRIGIEEQLSLIRGDNIEDMVRRSVVNTEAFKQRFRHCATRSLMVLRKYKGYDISVVRQQLRSDKVLRALEQVPNFPVVDETYREITTDMMDLPRARAFVTDVVEKGSYDFIDFRNESSPFSYGMILAGISDVVLMEDRAKMLRELQGKILDKIYGQKNLQFIVNDHKTVENYFASKVPRISNKDDIEKFAKHFVFIDAIRNRANSPYNYCDYDIREDIASLIEEDVIVSAHSRGVEWVHRDKRDIVKTLFTRNYTPNEFDQIVLDECAGKSFGEIKSSLDAEEELLKESLVRLESAYLIRRKMKKDRVVYLKDELPFKKVDTIKAIKEVVRQTIGSLGPLTLDELLIRVPIDSEILREPLEELISDGTLEYEYVTPVFSRQYILKEDLENLVNFSPGDLAKERLGRLTQKVENAKEYFDRYGFLVDPWSMRVRTDGYNENEVVLMVNSGEVLFGKIIKRKNSYVAAWLAECLHSLRYDPPSEEMVTILEYISNGHNTEELLIKRSGLERSIIRKILSMMEYHVYITRDSQAHYLIYRMPDDRIDQGTAFRILADKFGPVTADEISRFFWFYTKDIPQKSGVASTFHNGHLYYGTMPADKLHPIITRKYDPVELLMGGYSYEQTNSLFIEGGKDTAVLNLETERSILWASEVKFEDPDGVEPLVDYLVSMLSTGFGSLVVEKPEEDLGNVLLKKGFNKTGDLYSTGEVRITPLTFRDFLLLSLSSKSRKSDHTGVYQILESQILGIRTEFEAYYLGVTGVQLKNYYESRLIFQFNGPFGVTAYGTSDIISLYRSIRGTEITPEKQRIVKAVLEYGKASESEIVSRVGGLKKSVRKVIKDLYKESVLARDFDGKYIFVGEKYKEADTFNRLVVAIVDEIGYVNADLFSHITQTTLQDKFTQYADSLVKSGNLIRVVFSDLRSMVYCRPESLEALDSELKGSLIISPKDLIYRAYETEFKKAFKGRGLHYLVLSGSLSCAFTVRKSGRSITIVKILGDKTQKQKIKRELNLLGFSVYFSTAA